MGCSYDNTKKLARKKGIINNFDELIDNSGAGIGRYYQFALDIKNLAISKFGELPEATPTPMYLQGKKVIFNKVFFDWVDRQNAEKSAKYSQKQEINKKIDETPERDLAYFKYDRALYEQEQKEFKDFEQSVEKRTFANYSDFGKTLSDKEVINLKNEGNKVTAKEFLKSITPTNAFEKKLKEFLLSINLSKLNNYDFIINDKYEGNIIGLNERELFEKPTVIFNSKSTSEPARYKLHEFLHSLLDTVINEEQEFRTEIISLFNYVKTLPEFKNEYGIIGWWEFYTEGMTNPDFQAKLKKVTLQGYKGGKKSSVYEEFVKIINNILEKLGFVNKDYSALDEIINATTKVIENRYSKDNKNIDEQEQRERRNDENIKYQLAESELLQLKSISEQFNRDISELNEFNIRDLQREEKERKGEKLSEKDEEYFKNSKFSKNQTLNLGKPSSILQKVGMPNLPITIGSEWLLNHIVRDPNHNIKLLNLKTLVEAIHNPIAIFQDKQYSGKQGRIELVTTIKSKSNKPVDVIIKFDNNFKNLSVNSITTAFESNELLRFRKAVIEGNIKYIDKERIADFLQGVLLPTLEKSKVIQKGILVYPKNISDSSTNIEKFLYYVNNFPDILTKNDKKYQQAIATGDENLLQFSDNQSLTTGLEWLKQVLPNSNVQLVDGLIDKIGRGAYKEVEDLIVASKQYADKGTIKHEAIHRVLALLPENEREAILNEASKLFNIPRGKSTVKTKYSQAQQNEINYAFRAIENIQKNINKVVNWYGNKNIDFWKKLNEDLQIPKDQVELLKQTHNNLLNKARVGIPSNKEFIEEMLADFAANYSYTIEINTAKEKYIDYIKEVEEFTGYETEYEIEKETATQHYSNLTVPGGTLYQENEITIPNILFSNSEIENLIDKKIQELKNSGELEINCD